MKTTLTILLTLLIIRASACTCGMKSLKENQVVSYNSAELIFIGDVVDIDTITGNYKIEIVELLKGLPKTKTVNGTTLTSCSGFPSLGRWILYAGYDGETIEFSSCGMSRSFSDPQYVFVEDYVYPIPPRGIWEEKSPESTDIYFGLLERILTIKENALTDLKVEIEELRLKK